MTMHAQLYGLTAVQNNFNDSFIYYLTFKYYLTFNFKQKKTQKKKY